jgi:uncharacterized small protein (DUF1192 family)
MVQQGLVGAYSPEQAYASGLGRTFVAEKVGLGNTQADINRGASASSTIASANAGIANLQNELARLRAERQSYEGKTRKPGELAPQYLITDKGEVLIEDQGESYAQQIQGIDDWINKYSSDIGNYQNQVAQNQKTADLYNQYTGQLGQTREQLLTKYDPNRLAKLQALAQLSGQDPSEILRGVVR